MQKFPKILGAFDIEAKKNALVGSLSKGTKQKVAIIASTLHDPRFLVLDEPLSGLDPKTQRFVNSWITITASKGVTVFLSTHNLDIAQDYANKIAIIDRGKIAAVGGAELPAQDRQRQRRREARRSVSETHGDGKSGVSLASSVGNVATLVKFWSKGRFTRTTFLVVVLGEIALSIFLLFAGGTFLSFSARFGQLSERAQITEASWGLVLGFYLIGLVQSGFYGSGLPFVSADVDYVFTSPVRTTEVFTAKILAQFRQRITYLSADLFPILASHSVLRHTRYYGSGRGDRDPGVFLHGVIVQRGYYARTAIGFRAKDVYTKVSIDRLDSRG